MILITDAQRVQLLANGATSAASEGGVDHVPVVKLFTPWGGATWLLSELDPDDPDIAFGLCDLGLGEPELGSVAISEIAKLKGPGGLTVERDHYFTGRHPIGAYAKAAHRAGRIVLDLL